MKGLEVPERENAILEIAKNYLAQFCFSKKIKILQKNTDRDGMIAKRYLANGFEAGFLMIEAGLGLQFKKNTLQI